MPTVKVEQSSVMGGPKPWIFAVFFCTVVFAMNANPNRECCRRFITNVVSGIGFRETSVDMGLVSTYPELEARSGSITALEPLGEFVSSRIVTSILGGCSKRMLVKGQSGDPYIGERDVYKLLVVKTRLRFERDLSNLLVQNEILSLNCKNKKPSFLNGPLRFPFTM